MPPSMAVRSALWLPKPLLSIQQRSNDSWQFSAVIDFQQHLKQRGGHRGNSVLLLRSMRESRAAGHTLEDAGDVEKSSRRSPTDLDCEDKPELPE